MLGGGTYFPRSVGGGAGTGARSRYSPASFRLTDDGSNGVSIARHRIFGNFIDSAVIVEDGNASDTALSLAVFSCTNAENGSVQDLVDATNSIYVGAIAEIGNALDITSSITAPVLQTLISQKAARKINTSMTQKTITIQSGNLYQIAADEYGDATLWWLIASNNGLVDPQITTPITLKIPPANKIYVGGVAI